MSSRLERMQKGVAVVRSELLSCNLPGGSDERQEAPWSG